MANISAPRDNNRAVVIAGTSSVDGVTPTLIYVNPVTNRMLVDATAGSGTVTTITSNDGSITVTNPTTTPDLSVVSAPKLTTARTIAGVSFDGSANIAIPASGLSNGVTGSGNVVLATSPTLSSPVVGTQASTDNSTLGASTAYVTTAVSNALAGVQPQEAVQWATTTAGNTSGLTYNNGASGVGATFTGANNTAITIDGHTFVIGDVGVTRLLVKNDTQSPSGAFNGVYLFTALQTAGTGAVFTRATNYNTPSEMNNSGLIPVENGTANATTTWVQTATITTVGTTPLVFAQFSYSPTSIIAPNLGGTGVANNAASTVTISGNFGTTLTVSNTTALTLPTSGTVTAQGNSVTGSGSIVLATSPTLITPTLGVATATNAIYTNNAISAVSNAATVPITSRLSTVTNNSAATLTITITTTSAVDGQLLMVRVLDFSGVAETLTWVNTENSSVSVPIISNGSTTSFLTVGFIYNGGTSKWRCIAVA